MLRVWGQSGGQELVGWRTSDDRVETAESQQRWHCTYTTGGSQESPSAREAVQCVAFGSTGWSTGAAGRPHGCRLISIEPVSSTSGAVAVAMAWRDNFKKESTVLDRLGLASYWRNQTTVERGRVWQACYGRRDARFYGTNQNHPRRGALPRGRVPRYTTL